MKWLLTSAVLLFSCDAAGVPEIAGPLQFSASEVESCERLILTVPVTGNAHYVQAVLTSGEIEGVFKEPGDSAVARFSRADPRRRRLAADHREENPRPDE